MSKQAPEFDFFDPTGMLRTMRNDQMDAWAKMMVQLINTDAYAEATGKILDAWLATSAPFRKAMETTMLQVLSNLKMPSQDDVTRLAERLTNIELRLDDLDAKLDDALRGARTGN
jgi:hypothetical protein